MKVVMDGLDDLVVSLDALVNMPTGVLDDMLDAAADVTLAAQKKAAGSMLQGPYNKGAVAAAIRKNKPRNGAKGRSLQIVFPGTQHGNRIAEIAFINEFGKTNQPARPFIFTANEASAAASTQAAADVFDRYLTSKGL